MFDDKFFQKYIDKCDGNKFQAVRLVASLARSLSKKYDNKILDSEALTWILTGERPNTIDENGSIKRKSCINNISFMDDILSCVDDESVCESVRYSISESNKHKNLVYFYKGVPDECRQARVRVLVRMIWYNTHNQN